MICNVCGCNIFRSGGYCSNCLTCACQANSVDYAIYGQPIASGSNGALCEPNKPIETTDGTDSQKIASKGNVFSRLCPSALMRIIGVKWAPVVLSVVGVATVSMFFNSMLAVFGPKWVTVGYLLSEFIDSMIIGFAHGLCISELVQLFIHKTRRPTILFLPIAVLICIIGGWYWTARFVFISFVTTIWTFWVYSEFAASNAWKRLVLFCLSMFFLDYFVMALFNFGIKDPIFSIVNTGLAMAVYWFPIEYTLEIFSGEPNKAVQKVDVEKDLSGMEWLGELPELHENRC